jgi:hypothetical protein
MARDAWVCHAMNVTATGAAFWTEKTMTRVISTSTTIIVAMIDLPISLRASRFGAEQVHTVEV